MCSLTLLVSLALADTKIVATMTMTGDGAPSPQTTTSYFKGDKLRIESPQGTYILDGATGKTLMLNDKEKTYVEFTIGEMLPGMDSVMKSLTVKAKAFVKTPNEQKTIAGQKANKFIAQISMEATSSMMPGMTQNTVMNISGWTTAEIPNGLSPDQMSKVMAQMLSGLIPPGDIKPILAEMSKIKGLPLDQDTTIRMTMKVPNPGNKKKPQEHTMEMGIRVAAESVTELELDEALFKVPEGYKAAAPPTRS